MPDTGLTDLKPGRVGAVVTYLEMRAPPPLRPMPQSTLRLHHWQAPEPAGYRELFRRVGGRWLWYSRLAMDDATLRARIGEVHVVVDEHGAEVGMVELNLATRHECLIQFLGLVPDLAGKGHGAWLFAQVLALAWRAGIERVHVTTCTLDHPAALPSYMKAGFTAWKRALEYFPDPRLAGLLPRDIAPQIPLIEHPLD